MLSNNSLKELKGASIFLGLHKCQFVNNNPFFITIHSKRYPKTGENQIHNRGLDIYAMKIASTVVEMFGIAKMEISRVNMEEDAVKK